MNLRNVAGMMNNNFRSKNFIFLSFSAVSLTLGQLPATALPLSGLETNSQTSSQITVLQDIQPLEIPPLPNLGAANDYLPIEPPVLPLVTTNLVRLELRLGERKVYVFKDNEVIASYPVAIGRAGWETPTGDFVVRDMIENPGWENFRTGEVMPPGEDNPLGVRWISFWTDGVNEIGFHGTTNEELIGQAVSHGCVRMRNQDVMALFSKVSIGTPVVVKL